jgi:hypothetical protein
MANGGKSGNKTYKGTCDTHKEHYHSNHNLTQRLIPESRPHQNVKKSIQALYKMVDADLVELSTTYKSLGCMLNSLDGEVVMAAETEDVRAVILLVMRRTRRRGIWWVVTLVWRQTSCDCCG